MDPFTGKAKDCHYHIVILKGIISQKLEKPPPNTNHCTIVLLLTATTANTMVYQLNKVQINTIQYTKYNLSRSYDITMIKVGNFSRATCFSL